MKTDSSKTWLALKGESIVALEKKTKRKWDNIGYTNVIIDHKIAELMW